jgi:hypothetical protein
MIGKRGQGTEHERTVARVRGALEGYVQAYGEQVAVPAHHILDLLNPRGLWHLDPERARAARYSSDRAEKTMAPAPGLDPMTGCLPVTAPGHGEAPE